MGKLVRNWYEKEIKAVKKFTNQEIGKKKRSKQLKNSLIKKKQIYSK